MSAPIKINIPESFRDMFDKKWRYRIYYGGRGGGKSESIARALLVIGMQNSVRILCCREFQSSIADSVHKLLADIIRSHGLDSFYTITQATIRGANGTEFIFKGLRHNATEIKSMAGIDYCFVEEAEKVSNNSWELLIPTIRKDGSSITIVFNPKNRNDPTYERFVATTRDDALVKKISWRDNPFFPKTLDKERRALKDSDPVAYEHIWEGQFDTRRSGAVYAKQMAKARDDGRIGRVPYDPCSEVFTAWDLGWGDATSIWWGQFVGRELRWIDFFEDSGQQLGHYAKAIKDKTYNYMRQGHFLPHDGGHGNIRGESVTKQLAALGVHNRVLPRETDVSAGIELLRQTIEFSVFDADKCKDGISALENYSYKWDEERGIFKSTPQHDWTSHAADAARYMALAAKEIKGTISAKRNVSFSIENNSGGWMGV